MSATRLSNVEKRLEYVANRFKSFHGEEKRFIPNPSPIILGAARRALPFSVAIWSILELPIELILAQSPTERLASAVGRLIWVAFAFGTMYKMRFARPIFLFLCAVSSIVVAQALPMAYELSPLVFSVLVVDLVLKVSALLTSLIITLMAPYSR
jgi:hypothetical protein